MIDRSLCSAQLTASTLLFSSRRPLKPSKLWAVWMGAAAWLPVLLLIWVSCLGLCCIGCQSAQDEPAVTAAQTANAARHPTANDLDDAHQGKQATSSHPAETREAWEAHFIEGAKIGHAHIVWGPTEGSLVRITSEVKTTVERLGQTVNMRFKMSSFQTPDGRLVRCTSHMSEGAETVARVDGNQLVLETKNRGNTQTDKIPWDPSWGGYFADLVSLQLQPMRPGEKRTVRGLFPLLNRPAEFRLEAAQHESVKLLSSEAELLRIKGSILCEGVSIETVIWTNDQGEPLKAITIIADDEQTAFRTTKEIALIPADTGKYDLGRQMMVKVERQLADPHGTKRVVYTVQLRNADPAEAFVSGPSQTVERIDNRSARLTVRALRADDGLPADPDEAPSAADRRPNNLVQSDDPKITEMAQQATGDLEDPWAVACALERYVRDTVRSTELTQAMASAADVARNLEGDCTEHSVLLAALCRARQIPARVAVGLVYYAPTSEFDYHMWNEVWIRDRWIPLDGTLGVGGIGAAHLKVTHSNLAGVSPFSALLPVMKVLGQLKIEILEVE